MNISDSKSLRRRGLSALEGNWQTALLATFAAGIFDMTLRVFQIRVSLPATGGMNPAAIIAAIQSQDNSYEGISLLLSILSFVFTSALGIGLNYYFLRLNRREQSSFSLLFSRMHIFGKCLGQSIMIGVFVFLWGLILVPGIFLMYWAGIHHPAVVTVLMLLLMIPMLAALYRYAMAPYLLADDPDMGVMDSIRRSKEMMRGHKGRLFGLHFSFVGWLLLSVLTTGVLSLILPIIGTVIGLFTSLVVQVYINSAVTAFYLELAGQTPRPEKAKQEQAA